MSVLVTGGSGCLGYHLLNTFNKTKGDLISYSLEEPPPYRKLKHVQYYEGDILDEKSLSNVLHAHKPSEVYHLAAQNSVGISQKNPFQTLQTNILGTQCVLESVRKAAPKARVIYVSSSEIYGSGKGVVDTVHVEEDPPIPVTPFATSKSCGELVMHQYINSHGIDGLIIRPFHFTGPYQSDTYVLPSITRQLVEIDLYDGELSIYAGNLDISRDYIDVRDLARGISLLATTGPTGETYNICSGRATPIRELIDEIIGFTSKPIDIRINSAMERPVDIPLLVGSPVKIQKLTGWRPIISMTDSLRDLYSEMKTRVKMMRKKGGKIFPSL